MNNDNTPPAQFPLWTTITIFVSVLALAIFLNFNTVLNLWASQINPQTLEFYKAIGTVAVAVIAAVIAGGIQYRQWQTAHKQWETAERKLNVELLERRLVVYKATGELIRVILTTGKTIDAYTKFHTDTIDAEWLFDEEIAKYLNEEFLPLAIHFASPVFDLQRPLAANDAKGIKKAADEFTEWHTKEYRRRKAMFEPYLRINHVNQNKKPSSQTSRMK